MSLRRQQAEPFEDWLSRIADVVEELDLQRTAGVEALPVQLPHMKTGTLARATTDGIMLYDPVADSPVVSVGGAWKKIALIP